MKQKVFLSGMVLLAMAYAAWGDVTVYSDRASFEAAMGPNVTYTFETNDGFPAAPAFITSFGPVDVNEYNPSGGPAYIRNFPDGTTNQILSGVINQYNPNLTGELYGAFTQPEYAVGFDVYPWGFPVAINVQYGGSNPNTAQYILDEDMSVYGDASMFFGLTSSDPIASFTVESYSSSDNQFYKGIDNFTIVPEPAASAALGLLIILRVRRR